MGKSEQKFSEEIKRKAVDEYVSGRKSAAQVASELQISTKNIYNWRVQLEERAKGSKIDELESVGRSRADVQFILQLQAERDAYQKTVGEQTVIIELLKKRLHSTNSQQRSELTGLIEILEESATRKKRDK